MSGPSDRDDAHTSHRWRLLDSALLIAILSGICYVLGFIAQVRNAWQYGIPRPLLPDLQLEYTLTIGGPYLLLILIIFIIFYLFVIVFRWLMPKTVSSVSKTLVGWYDENPYFYLSL
jgi:hypothetical protein